MKYLFLNSLHQEILDYVTYMRPTVEEEAMRQDLVDRITRVALREWPKSKVPHYYFSSFKGLVFYIQFFLSQVEVFGSYASTLPQGKAARFIYIQVVFFFLETFF